MLQQVFVLSVTSLYAIFSTLCSALFAITVKFILLLELYDAGSLLKSLSGALELMFMTVFTKPRLRRIAECV